MNNNTAPILIYKDVAPSKQLAPVIPIKPVRKVSLKKLKKTVAVKASNQEQTTVTPVPAFTAPVFKPRKHDLL